MTGFKKVYPVHSVKMCKFGYLLFQIGKLQIMINVKCCLFSAVSSLKFQRAHYLNKCIIYNVVS